MTLKKPLLEEEQLFFMHIPKTAGTSLITLLDQLFLAEEICPIHEGYKNFLSFSSGERNRFKFIRGHFPYKLMLDLKHSPRTITFLRDPIDRTLSAMNHHYRLEKQGMSYFSETIGDISFAEFLEHPEFGKAVSNVALEYLNDMIGKHPHKTPSLSLAKERLETFDVIGVLEQLNKSLELMAYTFAFSPIVYMPFANVAPNRSRRSRIDQEIIDRIIELNRDEIELYEYALKLIEERSARMEDEQLQESSPTPAKTSPRNRVFNFERVDPGRGWHIGKKSSKHGITRWSGPETTSYLNFHLTADRAYAVRFRVLRAAAPDILESLSLEVNGKKIPLKIYPDGNQGAVIFEGKIPKKILSSDSYAELAFKVNRTIEYKQIQNLGICLYEIGQKIVRRLLKNRNFAINKVEYHQIGLLYHWLQIYPI